MGSGPCFRAAQSAAEVSGPLVQFSHTVHIGPRRAKRRPLRAPARLLPVSQRPAGPSPRLLSLSPDRPPVQRCDFGPGATTRGGKTRKMVLPLVLYAEGEAARKAPETRDQSAE